MSKMSNLDQDHRSEDFKKLRRQIEEWLRKFASLNDLEAIHKQFIERR